MPISVRVPFTAKPLAPVDGSLREIPARDSATTSANRSAVPLRRVLLEAVVGSVISTFVVVAQHSSDVREDREKADVHGPTLHVREKGGWALSRQQPPSLPPSGQRRIPSCRSRRARPCGRTFPQVGARLASGTEKLDVDAVPFCASPSGSDW
jgi:hypothetical protein